MLPGVLWWLFLAWVAAAVVLFLAMASTGMVAWTRTGHLRRGTASRPSATGTAPTVPAATMLAGGAGVAAAGAGAAATAAGRPSALALLLAGVFVALTGFRSRVTAVETGPDGLTIRYARRQPFSIAWSGCRSLRPPRTPLGGWRLRGDAGSRVLMPSDLLGHEGVLDALVVRSALRFEDGAWRLPEPAGRSPPADLGWG